MKINNAKTILNSITYKILQMKKNILFLIVATLFISSFYSCKKSEKQLMKRANNLVYTLLQDIPIDSVSILKVEAVTAMRYAEIVFETMEIMEEEYNIRHEEALFHGEIEEAEILDREREKVMAMKDFCLGGIISKSFDEKVIILYMVQFIFFEEDYAESGYFLMTPKFTLHEFAPFENDLLK